MQTFFHRCGTATPSVLVVVDQTGKEGYYGNGDTFVFTFAPNLQVFRWANTNPYWMMGGNDGIALGGGAHFAIWLTSDFERGSTGACRTFQSPPLAASEDFRVKAVEVYGLVPA
ncbi:putative TLD family protein [Paratrimastix pyriformis]|uniref:TLD family protein n=1 Tax=Paratrimastix pyriformis TaxID=342808 RepID=A0ABQ8UP44_9EUKA|nr:putative TLD family protein [Paratrimastix pyriformis]